MSPEHADKKGGRQPVTKPGAAPEIFGFLDAAIDAAIFSRGSDPRATVGSLLLALASHEAEIERLRGVISADYVRSRMQ